jgi:hypothetical protein
VPMLPHHDPPIEVLATIGTAMKALWFGFAIYHGPVLSSSIIVYSFALKIR